MTIAEAIQSVDSLKPNNYSELEKIDWLNKLDSTIKKEVIDTHEDYGEITFNGYDDNTSLNTELIVQSPYDIVYIYWLQSQIDYWNQELGKYNNSITMYNTAYSEYERYYNRTHAPINHKLKFF